MSLAIQLTRRSQQPGGAEERSSGPRPPARSKPRRTSTLIFNLILLNLLLSTPGNLPEASPCRPANFVMLPRRPSATSTTTTTTSTTTQPPPSTLTYDQWVLQRALKVWYSAETSTGDPLFEDLMEIVGDDEISQAAMGRRPRVVLRAPLEPADEIAQTTHTSSSEIGPPSVAPTSAASGGPIVESSTTTTNTPTTLLAELKHNEPPDVGGVDLWEGEPRAAREQEAARALGEPSSDYQFMPPKASPLMMSSSAPSSSSAAPSLWKPALLLLLILFIL